MSNSSSSRYSRRAKRESRRQLFIESRNDPSALSGTEYLQRERDSSLDSLSSTASRFSLNCPTHVEFEHESPSALNETESSPKHKHDDADLYFADDDEGPTDESNTVVSSHGSVATNGDYIHFVPSFSHLVAASIISVIMKPLTDEQEHRYCKAVFGLTEANANDAMVSYDTKGSKLSRAVISRLKPETWLNDELVNVHNRIILSELDEKIRRAIPGRKRCYFMSSYFIPTLINEKNLNPSRRGKFNYDNVKRWIRGGTFLFDTAYLFVPYNQNGVHWTLVVVAFQEHKIVYYDSFHEERRDIVNHVIEFLRMHYRDATGSLAGIPEWEVIMQPTGYEFTDHYSIYPHQTNTWDCGLFMLMFCYFISIGLPLVFDECHMDMIRKRLCLSILDRKPLVDPTLLPVLSEWDWTSETSPPPKRLRIDRASNESLPRDAVRDLTQICNGDDGGGKFTKGEKHENDFASKIIDIGINAHKANEVGVDLIVFDEAGKMKRPTSFGKLTYVQRQIMIVLYQQASDGRFENGITLGFSDQQYAREKGLHIQTLKSLINFVSLYKCDSDMYNRYRGDGVSTFSTMSERNVTSAIKNSDVDMTDATTPLRNNLTNTKFATCYPKHQKLKQESEVTADEKFCMALQPSSPPSSTKYKEITIHDIPMASPMRDIIANRPPKELNEHFRSELKIDGSAIITLKSEGEFEVRVPKTQFEALIEVTLDKKDGGDVKFLEWKSQASKFIRTTMLNRLLSKDSRFVNHIDARFDRNGRISAIVNIKLRDKPRRPSRAKHNWAVWQHGYCSHNQNKDVSCPCTFAFGFELDDINTMYKESRESVRMTGVVYNDCKHEKHKVYDRCAGVDRQEVRRAYAFNNSIYNGIDSKSLYENHKPGHHLQNKSPLKYYATGDSDLPKSKVTLRSRHVAWNIASESYVELMDDYGFKKGDTLGNLYKAAQLCIDQDEAHRHKLLQQHGESYASVIGGDKYLGILRKQNYEHVSGNRGTSPLLVQFFSKNAVQLYHEICKHGRGVIHVDGTKSRANLGATVKEGDKLQLWQMWLSPAFEQKSPANDDPNRFVRQNLSPKLLTEAHMADTTTNVMAEIFKRFFHAQWLICESFVCPLVVKTDCAKGLCAAVFLALTTGDATVATRVTYNNLMLVVLAKCSSCGWVQSEVSEILSFVLTIIPCLYSLCRPHAIRAGYHWIKDKKRSSTVRNNQQVFKEMVVNWLRHCTCTITISEAIVNVAIIIYTLEMRAIEVAKASVMQSNDSTTDLLNEMNDTLARFVKDEIQSVQNELATDYESLDGLSVVNPRFYRVIPLVREIVRKARACRLQTTYTYHSAVVDEDLFVETCVFTGFYPKLPGKQKRPTNEHFEGQREATYTTRGIRTKLAKKAVEDINTPLFSMANPVFESSVVSYLYEEWVKVITSLTGDIPRLCRLAVDAEVDNSNQMSEAGFKQTKYNKMRREYEKEAGLLVMFLWQQDLASNSLLINDLEHLPNRVKEHNARRAKRHHGTMENDHSVDVMEQSSNIPWEDKRRAVDRVREDLVEYIANNPARCGNTKKEVHDCMKAFFEGQRPHSVPFVSKDTLLNFLLNKTKKPKFNTQQIDTFIAFMRDYEVAQSSQVSEIYPDSVDSAYASGGIDLNQAPLNVPDESLLERDDDASDGSDMMDVEQEYDAAAATSTEPRPYDFVPHIELDTLENYKDDDTYDDDSSGDSYVMLIDDEDHNIHDEDDACEEDHGSEEDHGNEEEPHDHGVIDDWGPRIGITMHDCGMFGHLPANIQRYRNKWSILEEFRQPPERVRSAVMEHITKCIEDDDYGNSWASKLKTPLTTMELSDIECDGVEPYSESRDIIARDRKFLGDNMDPNSSAMNSSWSMALIPNLEDKLERDILLQLEERLPKELFPVADEGGHVDVVKVLRTNHDLPWLDDLRRYGKNVECANGAEDNRQPVRRTVSIVYSEEYSIEDPVNDWERGRKVLEMNVYTCREMPPDAWMTRPMTNLEYAGVMIIWRKCWPYLPVQSRRRAPTAIQYCVYQEVLQKKMGRHRDNFFRTDLKLLSEKEKAVLKEDGKWVGVKNSQVMGSAVIVYSMGNRPMKMLFWRLSLGGGAYQKKEQYEVEPMFSFRFEKGWICILDCIDDLLMLHSVTFEDTDESENPDEGVRVAMVMRLLDTVGQFYTDTATMRLSGESLEYGRDSNVPSGVCRNLFN